MAKGFKSGGRVVGTPNGERKALSEILKGRYPDYHPVLALAEIGNDMQNDIAVRLQAHKEVAKYICPQLKAVELTNDTDKEIFVTVVYDDHPKPIQDFSTVK